MQPTTDRPRPGSHDRSVPSGSLEESAANLFDAMLAAREAEERGERGPLDAFYRTLMSGTLLLPVPPEHGEEAKAALASAVNDDEQVEISVMLAREAGGEAVSVDLRLLRCAGGLVAERHRQPAASGADRDRQPGGRGPAGDHGPGRTGALSVRDRRAGGAGRWTAARQPTSRSSSPPHARRFASGHQGATSRELERSLATELRATAVEAAYLVETDAGDGRSRLMLGLVGEPGASATVDVPDGTDVVWLEEPLLAQVRAVAEPFHRRRRGR